MADPDAPRHVEVTDADDKVVEVKAGDETVAAAQVTTTEEGTAQASLHAPSGHIPPGSRANLVDAVLDLPEVQAAGRLQATVPLGDSETLERLRERTEDTTTRPAGSTALVDAVIPPEDQPAPGQEPDEA
jgi:hypothetical protein